MTKQLSSVSQSDWNLHFSNWEANSKYEHLPSTTGSLWIIFAISSPELSGFFVGMYTENIRNASAEAMVWKAWSEGDRCRH